MNLKLPEAEWLYLKDVCQEWHVKADSVIRLAAEGKLQLYAFACPDINAAYLRSLGRGESRLEQWKSSSLVLIKPETADRFIREEIDWLDYWITEDGSDWTGNWAHGAGGARLLPVRRDDLVIFSAEKKRFEAESTEPVASHAPVAARPPLKERQQESAIMEWLISAGYDPKSLPKPDRGKAGPGAAAWAELKQNAALFINRRVFDKAWARLLCEDIQYSE